MPNIHTRLRNNILWLILDHPPLNILSRDMLDQLTVELHKALKLAPHLIVITGAGERAFSVGIDVHDHLNGQLEDLLRAIAENCMAFERVRAHGIATVALVKGLALGGGCELAALCDTVLAHEDASFGFPEIGLGLFPPVACAYFPKMHGYQTTMRLILIGETITAQEALRLGLVHQLLSARRFLLEAEELLVMLVSTHRPFPDTERNAGL
jgi:enoyl-CoA hydratase/carnithine racemase